MELPTIDLFRGDVSCVILGAFDWAVRCLLFLCVVVDR